MVKLKHLLGCSLGLIVASSYRMTQALPGGMWQLRKDTLASLDVGGYDRQESCASQDLIRTGRLLQAMQMGQRLITGN